MRLRLAEEMIARCPASWDLAIALTGSASRGLADADSDIALSVWGHDAPGISGPRASSDGPGRQLKTM